MRPWPIRVGVFLVVAGIALLLPIADWLPVEGFGLGPREGENLRVVVPDGASGLSGASLVGLVLMCVGVAALVLGLFIRVRRGTR